MGLVYDLNTTALPFQSNTFNWHTGSQIFDGTMDVQDFWVMLSQELVL